jgi:hypothetical protein
MAIQVETFDVMELVRDGQDGLDIVPYRLITKDEQFVYKVLCPVTSAVENYDGSPIPLRVLQIVAHARELEIGKLEVWSAEGAVKDPGLVAIGGGDTRLLARWGSELEDFGVLKLKAVKLWKSVRLAILKRIQAQIANDLSATEAISEDVIPDHGDTVRPYYYSH